MRELTIAALSVCVVANSFAQKANWQNLDLATDSMFGISTEKAYAGLLKNKKPVRVIVAVIDSGIDTTHEDLKQVLWTDARNGSHGRNYIGYESGREDIAVLVTGKKAFFDSLSYTAVPAEYREAYKLNRERVNDYDSHVSNLQLFINQLKASQQLLEKLLKRTGKENPALEDFKKLKPEDKEDSNFIELVTKSYQRYSNFAAFRFSEIDQPISLATYHLDNGLNIGNADRLNRTPGSNDTTDVMCSALGLVPRPNLTPWHGTHVAGIIAASRGNAKGIEGVADNVSIMAIKVLSNIRELRDEDLASGIRFATDHVAKIINLSFGKYYTANKKQVDDAIIYAASKDVLIIHAAGNDNIDLDKKTVYPNRYLLGGSTIKPWIEVGASGWKDDAKLMASFSNYGKKTVDVFAPGAEIYSTMPYSDYTSMSGTSMATPVVSGLAALIRGYYPELTAIQVKEIILKSVVKRDILKDKCVSGGIVNAYNSLKLAATYK